MRLAAYQFAVSAIRINCQDLRPEVYGVEKMEIVTDYSEVVIETRKNMYPDKTRKNDMIKILFVCWGITLTEA